MQLRDTERSFRWIVGVLEKHSVPFVICGGLSAKVYGSPRSLNDIDIDIPDAALSSILEDVRSHIIWGPGHWLDERWDMQLMTLNHEGQEIDLGGGDSTRIRDARTGTWVHMPTDFVNVRSMEVFGLTVPVVTPEDLIAYKSMLEGNHQKIDIEAARKHIA